MKRLLLLSYFFPPSSEVAGKPTARLVRHLPHYGWEPVVIAPPVKGYLHLDPTAYADVSQSARIERTGMWPHPIELLARAHLWRRALTGKSTDRLSLVREGQVAPSQSGGGRLRRLRWRLRECLRFPDDCTGWIIPAYRRACALLHRESFDAVLSVSPAASAHLAARLVHRRFPHLVWFSQFHDPWSLNFLHDWPRPFKRLLDAMEAGVIRQSTRVAFATEEARAYYRERHPDGERFFVLPNGFDPLDFPEIRPDTRNDRRFTFTYAGSLYGPRNPISFLEGLASLIRQGRLREDEARVRLIGDCGSVGGRSLPETARSLGLASVVEITAPVPYSDALAALAQSDVLLLFAEGQPLQVPAKLFEYLALPKPILAFATGASARIVEGTRSGVVVTSDDPSAIEEAILALIQGGHRCLREGQERRDRVAAYEAANLAALLAQHLDDAVRARTKVPS